MNFNARWAACCLLLVVSGIAALGQEPAVGKKKPPATEVKPPDARAKDLAAIQQSAQAFAEAFNRANAKAVAALWTKDGDYTDGSGQQFDGREAIEKEYKSFFASHQGAKITIVVDVVRLLSDSAAIEDGRTVVEIGRDGADGSSRSRYTTVHVKVAGKWLMASVRDTPGESSGTADDLQDLEWLVGKWTAEEDDARMEVTIRWIAERAFLERTYSVTKDDRIVTSGVQIVGWNPQAGQIQSWSFSSDGGHATGLWSPHEGGWTIDLSGMLADGTSTTAVNRLTRVDENSFAWHSTDRTAGGVHLPDADEFVLRRSPLE